MDERVDSGRNHAPRDEHDEDPREKERLKRITIKVIVVFSLVALVLAVWGIASRLIERSHLKKAAAQEQQVVVYAVKPTVSGADNELVLPGNVTAFMEAPIYARTSGYLKAWYTDIGAHVHKGELLAEIETPEVDRQLAQARADLDTARANANLAQTTDARWQALAAKQAVSKQDAEEKAGAAAATHATEASAQQNVRRLEDLESFKRVVAPFDGVVTARNTDVGALINAGESSGAELFRVADIHKLRIYAQVPEPFAMATRAGLQAELQFSEHPGESYPAQTIRTSNALDPNARTLQVELQLDNPESNFLPGAYTEVHFKLPSAHTTLRVPSNTVLFRDVGLQVATIDPQHRVKLKTVSQGRDFGKMVEILGGLDPNDEVIVNPPDSVEDGLSVRFASPPQRAPEGAQVGAQGDAQGKDQGNAQIKDQGNAQANAKGRKQAQPEQRTNETKTKESPL